MTAARDPSVFDAEQVLEDFEEAWRGGTAPALEGLINALTRAATPDACELLQDVLTIDLEYRWRVHASGSVAGDLPPRPRIEDYLRRYPALGTPSKVWPALVAAEYKVRCWAGDRPSHSAYRTRFAALAAAVEAALADVDKELVSEGARRPAARPEPAAEAVAVTAGALLDAIRKHQLLGERPLQELREERADTRFPDALALAQHLIGRDWLTPFQANWLLKGRGEQLVVGSYVLLGRLGEGAMGKVYKARHQYLGRVAALKVFRKGLLAELGAEGLSRFYQEVEAAGRLSHPHVIHAYDAGPAGTAHVIAMEYHESIDLARLVAQVGPLPVEQACDYIRQAALGLQHAHERGLVHRDIKPSNLLVAVPSMWSGAAPAGASAWGLVKILDLGLARLTESLRSSKSLTLEGHLMGTPDYMAPEQADDPHRADIRADLYSLGCTLYFLLTAQPPFAGGNFLQKVNRHRSDPPRPVQAMRADVPAPVACIVHRLLAKHPAERFASPTALAAALSAAMQAPPTATPADVFGEFDTLPGEATVEYGLLEAPVPATRRRWRRWAVASAALAALGFAVLLVSLAGSSGQRQVPPPESSRKPEPERLITNAIGMKFALVPAGKFMMGSPSMEPDRHADEGPQHLVTISRPFYMGVHEVTQAQYQRVIGKNPSHFHAGNGGAANHPVECVSWSDAVQFCRKLSELSVERNAGRVYRLPTEAEWEYACRAGRTTAYAFGDPTRMDAAAWHKGNSSARSHEVGERPPNAWGLFDMTGNVWEWCSDYKTSYDDRPAVDPRGPESGTMRIFRGGCWMSSPSMLRAAHRELFGCGPNSAQHNIGFRVVCDVNSGASR